jgi:hypothetical protein
MPEHGLHAHGGSRHPVADHRLPPERELLPGGADHLFRYQVQHRDAPVGGTGGTGGTGGAGGAAGRGRDPPAVELPADPVGQGGRGQQPVVPPEPAALPAVGRDGPDLDPDAGQPAGREAFVHPLGERLGREHHRLGQRFRRVELLGHGQVLGRRTYGQRPGAQAAGQPVHGLPRGAEPAGHVAGRQRGQIPQRAQAKPVQQADQVLAGGVLGGQDAHRLPGQELRRPPGRDDQHRAAAGGVGRAGRQLRGEQPVGDAGPGLHAEIGDRGDDPGGQRRLAAEVAGRPAGPERAHPRLHRLDRRAERGHGGHYLIE